MSLEITKEKARKLYPTAPDWLKEELVSAFGEEYFKPKTFENFKTFEDACKQLGLNPDEVITGNDTSDEVAYKKLKIIAIAINEGWIPDWNNDNQKKWWPWFNLSSGFGFSHSYYDCTRTFATVGSRLCFETQEKSDYAAQQFIEIYKEFLTITK
jgi:hypothetical protein